MMRAMGIAVLTMLVSVACQTQRGLAVSATDSVNAKAAAVEQRLAVTLVDDSRVVGQPLTNGLPLILPYADVFLDWTNIREVVALPDAGDVRVNLINGDRLTGAVGVESLTLQTLFSETALNFQLVRHIAVHPSKHTVGLVLHYDFDNDADDDARVVDRSGHGHHGTRFGEVGYEKLPDGGYAIRTTSRNTYVACDGTALSLNGWHQLTFAARVQLHRYTTYGRLASKAKSGDSESRALGVSLGGVYGRGPYDGWFDLKLDSGDFARLRLERFADLNRWYHVAGVYDGRTLRFYVDGEIYAEETLSPALQGRTILDDKHNDLFIGTCAYRRTWTDAFINGLIDDVRIYDRALSPHQIRRLASGK